MGEGERKEEMGVGQDKGQKRNPGLYGLQLGHVLSYGFWQMDCRAMGCIRQTTEDKRNDTCGDVAVFTEEKRKEGVVAGTQDLGIKKGHRYRCPQTNKILRSYCIFAHNTDCVNNSDPAL